MSMATNRIATLAVAVLLASALVTSAVAVPKGGIPSQTNTHLPKNMSPTNLSSQECTDLGGTISNEAVCKSGKGCTTWSSCGPGCQQDHFACLTER